MTGPVVGRTIGAMAAASTALIAGRGVVAASASSGPRWLVVALAFAAVAYASVRLVLWSLLWARPRASSPDPRARTTAEAALDATEVAVVCDGESLVLVRTAAIAAIAATGSASRVVMVGADPRLEQLGRSLGVRWVSCDAGQRAGVAAAISAAAGEYLVVTSAATAVLPGATRPALEQFESGTVWVQSEPIGPGDRSLVDHVRNDRWWPSLDARGAMPWLGFGSIVLVEAFKTLPVDGGMSAATVAAQSRGWHGRWYPSMLAVEQMDTGASVRNEIDARAERFRTMRGVRSPLWARRLRPWQRVAHLATLVEDLSGAVAALAIAGVIAALVTGASPVPLDAWAWWISIPVVLGWSARWLLSGGTVRPGAMCRAGTDDIVRSLRSLAVSLAPRRRAAPGAAVSTRRGWRAQTGLVALAVAVDSALAWRAWQIVADAPGGDPRREGLLLASGVIAVGSLLSSARVLRRNRTLRGARRMPADIQARIGSHQGRVLDLSAGGLRVQFAAPAELLAELPIQLVAPGVRPVEARAQVVRVERRGDSWVLGMRLAGGGLAGEHDDYLALWLWQMAGAAEDRPRHEHDPVVGRAPWRAGGVPALRVLTAAAMVVVGVAFVPPGRVGLAVAPTPDATAAGSSAAGATSTMSTNVAESMSSPDPTASVSSQDTDIGAAGTVGDGGDQPTSGRVLPREDIEVGGDIQLATSVDDPDRQVEGGQVVAHTARLSNAGAGAVSSLDLVITPGVGLVDAASFGGTCPGAAAATAIAVVPPVVTWALFAPRELLEPGAECTITWTESLPAATDLEDGSVAATDVQVTSYSMIGRVGSRVGPSVTDELIVRRPTLRLTAEAGDGTAVAAMTIGAAFTWVLTVENISRFPVTAHGIDLVHSLPKNWVYTATVSVTPRSCDVAPVVLVDDAAASQTVTWSDMCDLDQGDEIVLAFSATPQPAAVDDPGVTDARGALVQHISTIDLTAEDAAGNPLGSAADRAGAVARVIDLVARLTDAGPDDGAAGDGPVAVVGGLGRYRIDIANEGPDGTTAPVTASLTVPGGIVAISATGEGWTCVLGSTVECTSPAPIGAGHVAAPIVVGLAIGDGALIDDGTDGDPAVAIASATVTAGGGGLDREASNDVDGESTMVRRDVDVSLAGVVSIATPMAPGARVDWILTPTVIGPAVASGELVIEDTMPTGLRFVSARSRGWTCVGSRAGTGFSTDPDANGTLSCRRQLRDVGPGAVLDALVVNVQIDPGFVGDATAPGRVVFGQDRNPANDWAAAGSAPAPEVSLTVLAVTGGSRVEVGADVSYEVVVTSQGPATDSGEVKVRAAMPAGLAVKNLAGDGWVCVTEPASDVSAGSWDCTWDASAAPVVSGTLLPPIEVLAEVTPAAVANLAPSAREPFVHVVTAVGSTSGAKVVSDRLSWTAAPITTNTVSIVDQGSDPRRVGEARTIEVKVGNEGPTGEYGPLTVQVPVTAAMDVTRANGDGWVCGATPRRDTASADPDVVRTIECTHGRRGIDYGKPLLAPGGTLAPIELTVVPAESGSLVQAVRVSGVTDPVWHRATNAIDVARRSGMAVDVTGPSRVRIGDKIELVWTVANAGPSESMAPVVITGALPAGLTLVGAVGAGWSCATDRSVVTCERAEALAADASSSVTVTAAVDPGAGPDGGYGEVTVTAVLRADPDDATADDDVDGVKIRVRPAAAEGPTPDATSATTSDGTADTMADQQPSDQAPPASRVASDGSGREFRSGDLLGYGGAAGSIAFAILLLSGRRRRGW